MPHLQSLVEKIEKQYCDLLQKLECSDSPSASNTKKSISRNKAEFDTRYQEYVKLRNSSERLPKSSEDEDCHSAYSLCDSRSVKSSRLSASSRSSVKLREAEVEFRVAQLKAKQAAERAKEEALLLQQQEVERRNAEREMEIAAAKMQAWQQQDSQEFDRNADIIGNRACFSNVAVNSNNLNVDVASSSGHIATAVFPEKQIAKTLTKVCPGATKVSATVANRT